MEQLSKDKEYTFIDAKTEVKAKYDNNMFCPKCRRLLTGLHMQSRCYTGFVDKQALILLKQKNNKA